MSVRTACFSGGYLNVSKDSRVFRRVFKYQRVLLVFGRLFKWGLCPQDELSVALICPPTTRSQSEICDAAQLRHSLLELRLATDHVCHSCSLSSVSCASQNGVLWRGRGCGGGWSLERTPPSLVSPGTAH